MPAQLTPRNDVGVIFGALWLGAGAAALLALALNGSGPLPGVPLDVPVYWLASAFALCEFLALRVVKRQGQFHGFTLAEVPLAVGLVYAAPATLVTARVVGVAVVLALMRRRLGEVAVELMFTAAQALAAIGVFSLALGDAEPLGWRGVAALLAAVLSGYAVALAGVACAVWAGGWPVPQPATRLLTSVSGAAVLDALLGLAVVLLVWQVPDLGLLLVAVALACLGSNRLYNHVAERHARLEIVNAFAGSVVRSDDLADISRSVLERARTLLHADNAVLLLGPVTDESAPASRLLLTPEGLDAREVPPDEFAADIDRLLPDGSARVVPGNHADGPRWLAELSPGRALAAPITNANGDISGALVVARTTRRLGFGFGEAQAELLGLMAAHASMALENGALFAQLRREMDNRAYSALHDPLTGLPNRAHLELLLDEAVVDVDGVRNRIGLLVIDLDEFSQVSDAFSRASTDDLLVQACRRINGLLPTSAQLCRIGPNEFAAILRDVPTVEEAQAAARLLIAGFDPPFQVEGVLLPLALNIGVAVFPVHAVDVPSLIARTHIARDTARRLRTGNELYDPVHDPATPRRLALGAELREAIEAADLDVCFQPKVGVTSGVVKGAEALVRWDHPRLGRVRPAEFIAVAEHTGDIRNLTMVVMQRSLEECRGWRERGMDLSVAVNLSARNLLDLNLVDDVANLIEASGVPPSSLTLELTESTVMSDSQRSVAVVEGLAELGVCLSCDDFGTGYSSLAHLRRLPIGEIKIDRSFITRMAEEESDRAIARSVLALGRDLGLTTVAEGVESSAGLELLAELGCDLAQGFYVCPPVPAQQFVQWLAQREAEQIVPLRATSGSREFPQASGA
jgi:diguanylate cyclase (GGDEF)-like protein